MRVRVIEYRLSGSDELYRLITTLLDPQVAPAEELAALYHERWEIDIDQSWRLSRLCGDGVGLDHLGAFGRPGPPARGLRSARSSSRRGCGSASSITIAVPGQA